MVNIFERDPLVKRNNPEQDEIFDRISQHSCEYDKEADKGRTYSQKEIREAWRVEEWKVGDTVIKAIGVCHVPETFLVFRQQIEEAIKDSDLVINEFTPEASGYYDISKKDRFKKIPAKMNPDYNLEQLRQAFIHYGASSGVGSFQHEVELLSAKFGKDMACIDLMMRDPEIELQDSFVYYRMAAKLEGRRDFLKQLAISAVAGSAEIAGLCDFLNKLSTKNLSRRNFLKSAGLMAGGLAAFMAAPKLFKHSEISSQMGDNEVEKFFKSQDLRDIIIADNLKKLSGMGYKKIVMIYGVDHLKPVKEFLDSPLDLGQQKDENQKMINQINNDSLRIYRLAEGDNQSECFVASKKKKWQRIAK